MTGPRIGVLALQGDVREHLAALHGLGAPSMAVRRPDELAAIDALVLPGGESTTIGKLLDIFDLLDPLRARLAAGMPAFGSCAGLILLARDVVDGVPGQQTLNALDVTVRRNAFGRQVESFEGAVAFADLLEPVHGVFIRAPWVESCGEDVQVLARVSGGPADGRIVAVRQGAVLATSFHPELTGDLRVHRYFLDHFVHRPLMSKEA